MTYDIICPHCTGVYHETNSAYNPDRPANGSMFRLKPAYVEAGWSAFPPYDTTEYANLTCPACDQPYVDSEGRIIRMQEQGNAEWMGTQYATVKPPTRKTRVAHGRV
jgi:hypothetical protein